MAKFDRRAEWQREGAFGLPVTGFGWKGFEFFKQNKTTDFTVATVEKAGKDTEAGISFFESSGEIHILAIEKGSLFDGSGLKIGQTIVAINGKECPVSAEDASSWLKAHDGPLTIVAVGEGISKSKLHQSDFLSLKPNFWQSLIRNHSRQEDSQVLQQGIPPEPKPGTVQSFYTYPDDTCSETSDVEPSSDEIPRSPVPERLVDFFCVIGPQLEVEKSNLKNPSDLQFKAKLVDCYPKSREDMEFPDYLPMFCFPNGYRLQPKEKKPTLSTFMLTSGAGHRLYGSALYLCEALPLSDLCELFWSSNLRLPSWLEEGTFDESLTRYFLPKCLVVLSHHAFYTAQTTFLKQIFRISRTRKVPLPLERYIANFVHDIPLPKPGCTRIRWNAFTKDTTVTIARPASNELPLVNFSYRPLFRCLSVSNIIAIWGMLLQEGRVVLRSEHMALLTPVAEALTSLLFPLTWQGMYIPILPSHMVDVLDAPVPFLVGLVGSTCPQPDGVVVCDLDQDVVQLGWDVDHTPQMLPELPRKLVMKLKESIEVVADPLYLIPPSGIKGKITTAAFELLENSKREPYALMSRFREVSSKSTYRKFILSAAEFIPEPKPIEPSDFELTGQGDIFVNAPECEDSFLSRDFDSSLPQMVRSDEESDDEGSGSGNLTKQLSDIYIAEINMQYPSPKSSSKQKTKWMQWTTNNSPENITATVEDVFAKPSPYTVVESDEVMEKKKHDIARELYELDEKLAKVTRHTFSRFFLALMKRYNKFLNKKGNLRCDEYVSKMTNLSIGSRKCVETIFKSQMFERFLHESVDRRKLFDELMMLHESLESKHSNKPAEKHDENASVDTPFLDKLPLVTYDLVPEGPCRVGVGYGRAFTYEGFPRLDQEELVANNTLDPISAVCHGTLCSPSWWLSDN